MRLTKLARLAAAFALTGLAACGGGGSGAQSSWQPFVYQGPTVVTKSEIVTGSGAEALAGKTVKVLLAQWQYKAGAPDFKGDPFTGQAAPLPYTFTLRIEAGAPALADAVVGMRVGGKRSAVIPGDMDPGTPASTAAGGVPRRAPSVAEIELLEIN